MLSLIINLNKHQKHISLVLRNQVHDNGRCNYTNSSTQTSRNSPKKKIKRTCFELLSSNLNKHNTCIKKSRKSKNKPYHVRVFILVYNPSVLKLDVEILIDRVKSPSDCKIVLELHRHFSANQLLEVREEQLREHQKKKNQIYKLPKWVVDKTLRVSGMKTRS